MFKPVSNSSDNRLIYLRAQAEQTENYLKQALEETKGIEPVSLRQAIQAFINQLLTQLQPQSELGGLLNSYLVDKVDEKLEDLLETLVSCEENLSGTESEKALAQAMLGTIANYLRKWMSKEMPSPTDAKAYWLSIRPQVEQAICQHDAEIKAAFTQLLQETAKLMQSRYKPNNIGLKQPEHPSCFISYAWPILPDNERDESWTQPFIKQLVADLEKAGIKVKHDISNKQRIGHNLNKFMEDGINKSDFVILLGTHSLMVKLADDAYITSAIRKEYNTIDSRRKEHSKDESWLLPIVLTGDLNTSLPAELKRYTASQSFQDKSYLTLLKMLLEHLYRPRNEAQRNLFEALWQPASQPETLNPLWQPLDAEAIYDYYQRQQQTKAKLQQQHKGWSKDKVAGLPVDTGVSANQHPFHHNLPSRNTQFVGRKEVLMKLGQDLRKTNISAIVQNVNTNMQTIQGLGGIGKTQLAIEYAYTSLEQGEYQLIWWLDAKNIISGYLDLADYLKIAKELKPEERIKEAKHKLAEQGHWLLIMDDAEDYDSIQAYLPSMPGHILITSRYTEKWQNSLTLAVFSRQESVDLLIMILGKNKTNSQFVDSINELAELLGDLPLALAQAGAYIKNTQITLSEYINLFEQQRQLLWEEEQAPRNYLATVKTTWTITINKIAQSYPRVHELLRSCAFTASQFIPRGFIVDWLKDRLTSLQINRLLGELNRYSLITLAEQTLTLHQLVQLVIQDTIPKDKQPIFIMQTLKLLTCKIDTEDKSYPIIQQRIKYLPHIEACLKRWTQQDELQAFASNQIGLIWLRDIGQPSKALLYFKQALTVSEALCSELSPHVATLLNNIGLAYQGLSQQSEALRYFEQALMLYKDLYGGQHPHVALALNNIGYIYHDLGQLDKALPYFEQALTITKTLYGEQHFYIISSLNNIGTVYQDLDQLDKALPYFEQALAITQTHYPEQDSQIATCLNNVGVIYKYLGQLDKALPYFEQALTITKTLYGEQHPYVVTSLNNVGLAYGNSGQPDKAFPYLQQALTLSKALHGELHPSVAVTLNNIVMLYQDLGKLPGALSYLEQTLIFCKTSYAEPHPHVIILLNNVGQAYQKLGQPSKALPYLKQALMITKKLHGEHPLKVIKLYDNIGQIYKDLNQPDKAIPYFEQALTLSKTLYGEQHPYIASLLNKISLAYKNLGQMDKALSYLKQALICTEKCYGSNHPQTAIMLRVLAIAHGIVGDIEQKKTLLEHALTINETYFGKDHPEVATTLAYLTEACLQLKEFTAAKVSIAQALAIIENHPQLPAGHPVIQQIRDMANAVQRSLTAENVSHYPSMTATVNQAPSPAQSKQHAALNGQGLFGSPTALSAELMARCKISDTSVKSLAKGLRMAACNNYPEDLKRLIPLIDDINMHDDNPKSKRTALHWAVERGHKACVDLLLKLGADASLVDAQDQSPLTIAQTKGDAELISFLNASVPKSAGPG